MDKVLDPKNRKCRYEQEQVNLCIETNSMTRCKYVIDRLKKCDLKQKIWYDYIVKSGIFGE